MGAKQQKVRIKIPSSLDADAREQLSDDIIETIRRRTERGLDVNNKKFPGYSASYMKSLDFKIAGKGKKVDLTLSGDMLASMDIISHRKGEIVIGFESGTDENARAEGNILGSYGGDPNPKRARNFLGIAPGDLARILKHYED